MAAVLNQPRQLLRLQREGGVRSAVRPGQGDVLFDDAGAQRDGGHRRGGPQRVIRQTGDAAEVLGQARDHAQVGVGVPGRIGADAMQQGDGRSGFPRRLHCRRDLARAGHAGGDDQGPSGARGPADQRQVDRFEGGDLEGRRVQPLEQLHGGLVEGRGETGDATAVCAREQRLVPFEGREGFRIEVVEGAPRPEAALDDEARASVVEGDGVGGIGLQLDRVRAGLGGGVDQLQRPLQASIVVARQLGDHIGRTIRPDRTSGDGESFGQAGLLR